MKRNAGNFGREFWRGFFWGRGGVSATLKKQGQNIRGKNSLTNSLRSLRAIFFRKFRLTKIKNHPKSALQNLEINILGGISWVFAHYFSRCRFGIFKLFRAILLRGFPNSDSMLVAGDPLETLPAQLRHMRDMGSSNKHLYFLDAAFLLTVGSFLLIVEPSLLTIVFGVFLLLTVGASWPAIAAFLLTLGKCF